MFSVSPAAPVVLAVATLASLLSSPDAPQFRLGFKLLADQIPAVVGEPLEEEHHNPRNGDAIQATSTGLMVWRKADNWTAFTTGWRSWVNGPLGVQERGNEERFAWESALSEDSDHAPTSDRALAVSTVASTPTPDGSQFISSGGSRERDRNAVTPSPATPGATSSPTLVPPTVTRRATATPVPVTPTRTPSARAVSPSPTPRVYPGGVVSPSPAGQWVTSTSSRASYYTSRDSQYWKSWAAQNRIWFATEAELLAAFPGRTRR